MSGEIWLAVWANGPVPQTTIATSRLGDRQRYAVPDTTSLQQVVRGLLEETSSALALFV